MVYLAPSRSRDTGAVGLSLRVEAPGWQVWEYPSGDSEVGNMNDLARETRALRIRHGQ